MKQFILTYKGCCAINLNGGLGRIACFGKMQLVVLCLLLLLKYDLTAQISQQYKPQFLLLAGVRTDAELWKEYGLMYFGEKHVSFQLKGSYLKEQSYSSNIEISGSVSPSNGRVEVISSYYYLKPSYVLAQRRKDNYTFFVLVNGMFSGSRNSLSLKRQDPLLGEVTDHVTEVNYYRALEFEANWHINLGNQMAVSMGVLVGSIFESPAVFASVYNGAFKELGSYIPGAGYNGDAYLKLNLGLVFKPHK
jgi:hypothetical protein